MINSKQPGLKCRPERLKKNADPVGGRMRFKALAALGFALLFGEGLVAQHPTNLINYFKYDEQVRDYYRRVESVVIARQIAVVDRPLGDKVLFLVNSKEFQISLNNELIDALNKGDDFMRAHQLKSMLVELVTKTYPQISQILSHQSVQMVMAEQRTEIQAFAGDAPDQFSRLKGYSKKPQLWLTSITDSPLGICDINSNSGKTELTCIPTQEGLSKDGLIALCERERDSITEALSSSITDKHDKNSDFHLMRITTFALKSGAEVEVGVVGDDRASVVIYFRAPK